MMGGYGVESGLGYNMMGGGLLGGLFMLLFGIMILAGFVLLVIWAVKASDGRGAVSGATQSSATGHEEAVRIVKKRLASGEITAEEYKSIMLTLEG